MSLCVVEANVIAAVEAADIDIGTSCMIDRTNIVIGFNIRINDWEVVASLNSTNRGNQDVLISGD